MDRIPSVNLLPTFLAVLLLHSVPHVQTRSLLGSGNHILQSKDDATIQNRIIALLLHKITVPDQEGAELGSKTAELQELETLREQLSLERQLVSKPMDRTNIQPSKRGDACFWKYCV